MPDCRHLRIVFAGTPEFAAVTLDHLIDSPHDVVGVLTQPDRPAGRGRKLRPGAVKQRVLDHNEAIHSVADDSIIAVQQPASLKYPSAIAALASLKPDVLVVAAYGLILPKTVLSLPSLGCLNIHASLLPRWRGAAPIHRAILAGDSETGVCIMQMDRGLDTGAVLRRVTTLIGDEETTAELHDRLASLGATALLETLPGRCDGSLTAVPQAESNVTYAEKLSKAEARLDFRQSADELHRRIRAFNPWPVAESTLAGERIRIWRSRLATAASLESAKADTPVPGTILSVENGAVQVSTADGVLDLLELQRPGGRAVSADVFAHERNLIGMLFKE
ncbi:MAG: methionyl-tRNA formyltransferase [Granulosicoccus sp.]